MPNGPRSRHRRQHGALWSALFTTFFGANLHFSKYFRKFISGKIQLGQHAAQPCFKKPRGRAPLAEGKPCTWNGEDGFWVTANGCHHDVAAARKAAKAEDFKHLQRIDKEEQKQRRSLCARIAAAVEASGRPAPSASRPPSQAF